MSSWPGRLRQVAMPMQRRMTSCGSARSVHGWRVGSCVVPSQSVATPAHSNSPRQPWLVHMTDELLEQPGRQDDIQMRALALARALTQPY